MPLTGEAKREYQKHYMRRRADRTLDRIAQSVVDGVVPRPGPKLKLSDEAMERKVETLRYVCRSKGLDLDLLVSQAVENLNAKKTIVVAGEAREVRDNGACIQAWPHAHELLQSAGIAPVKAKEESAGGNEINVNVLVVRRDSLNAES